MRITLKYKNLRKVSAITLTPFSVMPSRYERAEMDEMHVRLKEWVKQEPFISMCQVCLALESINKTLAQKGLCADWSYIHKDIDI